MNALAAPDAMAPRAILRRDRALPIIIAASLLVHAVALLCLVGREDRSPAAPREISIELVQLPKPPVASSPSPPKHQGPPQQVRPASPKIPEKLAARKAPAPKPPIQKAVPKPQQSVAERMNALLGSMPTAMPAVAMPGQAADGADAVSYPQLVLSKLAKAKKEGRYQGVPGRSSVAFTLGVAGQVVSVTVTRPSGNAALDEEAVAMVRRGEPYPPPPLGGQRDYAITLVFRAMP